MCLLFGKVLWVQQTPIGTHDKLTYMHIHVGVTFDIVVNTYNYYRKQTRHQTTLLNEFIGRSEKIFSLNSRRIDVRRVNATVLLIRPTDRVQ